MTKEEKAKKEKEQAKKILNDFNNGVGMFTEKNIKKAAKELLKIEKQFYKERKIKIVK